MMILMQRLDVISSYVTFMYFTKKTATFFVIQKSTEPNKITDKYINPFWFVKNEIIMYITNAANLNIKVNKQINGCDEFL